MGPTVAQISVQLSHEIGVVRGLQNLTPHGSTLTSASSAPPQKSEPPLL
jgi:hypothetical protein